MQRNTNKLSIIIPCYNVAGALPQLINKCREVWQNNELVEFIFVNNGSTDSTQEILLDLFAKPENRFGKIITIPINQGYGFGILEGLNQASGDILSWTHADLQCDPFDVVHAFDKYKDLLNANKCIVKGRRVNRNLIDRSFTFFMSIICSVLLKKKLTDINAQPKIFNKQFYESIQNAPFDFSLDLFLLYTALKSGLKIQSFPVKFIHRETGVAKGGGNFKGKLKLIRRTIKYILALHKNR